MSIKDFFRTTNTRVDLINRIRAVEPYYEGESDHRIIEDALKAWLHTLSIQQRAREALKR